MTNNNLSQEVLKTIEEKHIQPKPKWHFLLKERVLWFFGLVLLVVGGLATSVVIFMLKHNDWDLYAQVSDSLLGFIFVTLPYFWIILLVLFIVAADYNYRHTKKGYRQPLSVVVFSSIGISIVLGFVFFGVGLGQTIDTTLTEQVPLYTEVANRKAQVWTQPEQGRLAGVVQEIGAKSFVLTDANGATWTVLVDERARQGFAELQVGRVVKMGGVMQGEAEFVAQKLKPGPVFERGLFTDREELRKMKEDSKRIRSTQ